MAVPVPRYEVHTYGRCCIVFWQGSYVVDLENIEHICQYFQPLQIVTSGYGPYELGQPDHITSFINHAF